MPGYRGETGEPGQNGRDGIQGGTGRQGDKGPKGENGYTYTRTYAPEPKVVKFEVPKYGPVPDGSEGGVTRATNFHRISKCEYLLPEW